MKLLQSMQDRHRRLAKVLDEIPFNGAHVWLIFLVALGAIFDAVEQYNVGYAAPILTKVWGITSGQVGLLGTFTFGGMALGSLIAGILGDKVGRRTTYMYNLALYTLGALIGAFAPNIETLFIGRLIVGQDQEAVFLMVDCVFDVGTARLDHHRTRVGPVAG